MEAVAGLCLMLLGVSGGVETYCDGRQNRTQCYGALGGTAVFRLMNNASEISRFQWMNNSHTILDWRNNAFQSNLISDRSSFTPGNGTFRINSLSRNDSGDYKLNVFDSGGRYLGQRTLKFFIQAPVSSVLLVSECLSQGEMRVSCSSVGGESPQYNWTLDGHTLTDAELLSGNHDTSNITLKQNVVGRLVCSVRNNVSCLSREETISTCGFIFINCTLSNGTHISQWVSAANNTLCIEPTTATTTTQVSTNSKETVSEPIIYPVMAGVLSALVILLVVGGAVIFSQKKKKTKKAKEEAVEKELTYADISITQQPGLQVRQRAEVEVEYDQVKFSKRPQKTVEPTGDDCVYSQVRKGR